MLDIHVIGVGALGSSFSLELAKKLNALGVPASFFLYDYDDVEERNVVAQEFYPNEIGVNKAEALAARLSFFPLEVKPINKKVQLSDFPKILKPFGDDDDEVTKVVVDCVDNYKTREDLWLAAKSFGFPLLHLAISEAKFGYVGWTLGEFCSYPVTPASINAEQRKELLNRKKENTIPPCELSSYRGLILNTSMAGVYAMALFLGFNVWDILPKAGKSFALAAFSTSSPSIELIEELTHIEEEEQTPAEAPKAGADEKATAESSA